MKVVGREKIDGFDTMLKLKILLIQKLFKYMGL